MIGKLGILDEEVSLREGNVFVCKVCQLFFANLSVPNLVLVWFFCYLDTAPLLRQSHIGRVRPRFVRDGGEEPEGPKWGGGVGDALQHIGCTYFGIDSAPTV